MGRSRTQDPPVSHRRPRFGCRRGTTGAPAGARCAPARFWLTAQPPGLRGRAVTRPVAVTCRSSWPAARSRQHPAGPTPQRALTSATGPGGCASPVCSTARAAWPGRPGCRCTPLARGGSSNVRPRHSQRPSGLRRRRAMASPFPGPTSSHRGSTSPRGQVSGCWRPAVSCSVGSCSQRLGTAEPGKTRLGIPRHS